MIARPSRLPAVSRPPRFHALDSRTNAVPHVEALSACEDGVLDRVEAIRIKPLAAQVRRVATAIEGQCDRAISEGVVSLVKGGN